MLRKIRTLLESSPMFVAGLVVLAFALVIWLIGPAGNSGEDVSIDGRSVLHVMLFPLIFMGLGLVIAGWIRTSMHRHRKNKSLEDR